MQPINYLQGYQDPLQVIMGQVHAFQQATQNANVLTGQQEQNRLARATNDRHIQAMDELNGLDFADENALKTWAGRYGDLEYGKGLHAHLAKLDEKAKKAEIGRVSQVYAMLKNGRGDLAIADLEQQATAFENAGDKANADGARQMAQLIADDPKSALMQVGMSYAYMMPKDAMGNYKDFLQAQTPTVQNQDMGGYVMSNIIDPVSGNVSTQRMGDKTQSPDNFADNQRAVTVAQIGAKSAENVANINGQYGVQREQMSQQGQNMRTQAQLAFQQQQEEIKALQGEKFVGTDGYMHVYYPSKGYAVKMIDENGQPIMGNVAGAKGSPQAEAKRISTMETLIAEAENLLKNPDATGGTADNWLDKTGAFFGYSTKGGEITARLQTIAGQLTAQMPRMEGPQSDKDVELYRQMAGDVANANLPVRTRLGALQTMKTLNEKYKALNGIATQQPQQQTQSTQGSYASNKYK